MADDDDDVGGGRGNKDAAPSGPVMVRSFIKVVCYIFTWRIAGADLFILGAGTRTT